MKCSLPVSSHNTSQTWMEVIKTLPAQKYQLCCSLIPNLILAHRPEASASFFHPGQPTVTISSCSSRQYLPPSLLPGAMLYSQRESDASQKRRKIRWHQVEASLSDFPGTHWDGPAVQGGLRFGIHSIHSIPLSHPAQSTRHPDSNS
jgi:hypothetical protein